MNFELVKNTLVKEAENNGLSEYDVFFMESESKGVETLKDEVSSVSSGVNGGICFRCIVDGHIGCASTELLDEKEMKELVLRAIANAKSIESDDEAVIYGGSEKYDKVTLPHFEKPDTATLKEFALSTQKNVYAQSEYIADGTQSGTFCEALKLEFVNSSGLELSYSSGFSGAYVQAVINKDGEPEDAFDYCMELNEGKLKELPKKVVTEAISKLGADEIATGAYDVIFDAKQVRALLSTFASVFSAKSAQLGLSLLKDKEGEMVAAECITIVDDPMREGFPMQIPFDGEGVASYKKSVIENGVLKTLLYDLATAKKAGREISTGNGQRSSYSDQVHIAPYSFYIEGGKISRDELIALVDNGVLITEMKGLHAGANAVTGDFSIESAGFVIRDGKLAEPIHSFTVAGNFFELLKTVETLDDNLCFGMPSGFTSYGAPDILVRKMSIAGK